MFGVAFGRSSLRSILRDCRCEREFSKANDNILLPLKSNPNLLLLLSLSRTDECDLCIKLPVVSRRQATFRLVKIEAKAGAGGEDQIVFVVANYGKTNPTKLNAKANGPQ